MTLNTDPHLIAKINSCPTSAELTAMRDAIRSRQEQLTTEAVEAFARRRVHLEKLSK